MPEFGLRNSTALYPVYILLPAELWLLSRLFKSEL